MQTESTPPIPEGLDVITTAHSAIIRRSWFSHVVWFLVFFCIAWDGFLVFWYSMALGGMASGESVPWIMILFPIAHVAAGVVLTYFMLCMFLNKTDIEINASELTVRTHPLPWAGNKQIPSDMLRSFSVRERQRATRSRHSSGYSIMYDVMYVTTENREKTLVKNLRREEDAEYIAGALSRYYGAGGKSPAG